MDRDRRRANRSRTLWLASALAAATVVIYLPDHAHAQARALTPLDLVNEAVEAIGGADALRGLQGLAIKGEVRHWEPEELYFPRWAAGLH